jgi:hypothetical protein
MKTNQPLENDESADEAKAPGLVLALVMGTYPIALIGFIVLALVYMSISSPPRVGGPSVPLTMELSVAR